VTEPDDDRPALVVYVVWHPHATVSADLARAFSTDLPGWEGKGSHEAIILGKRFAATAAAQKLAPRFWVRFVKSILDNPTRHKELCDAVGVVFGSRVPDWKQTPDARSLPLQDLAEIGLSVRSAL
jgi:hypothetical protein